MICMLFCILNYCLEEVHKASKTQGEFSKTIVLKCINILNSKLLLLILLRVSRKSVVSPRENNDFK